MKKIIICVISAIILITGVVIFFVLSPEENTKPQYMPCPVLEEGETIDVVIPESMYYGSGPYSMCGYAINEGRCVDAWVTDYGVLVMRLDQETLEKNWNIYYDELMGILNSKLSTIKKEVSYDYSVLTLYVGDDTSLEDFARVMMLTPGNCFMLKLLQGVPSYEVNIEVIVIYEPTGKEILRLDKDSEMNLNRDDWDKLLESGRQE